MLVLGNVVTKVTRGGERDAVDVREQLIGKRRLAGS